jgi:hypothetical protein
MPPIAPAAAAPPASSGPRTFVAAEAIVSPTDSSGPWPFEDDPFDDERLAVALRGVDLAAALLRAVPPERDLARVDAALLVAADRERDVAALLLRPALELARELGVDSAMVSLQGSG